MQPTQNTPHPWDLTTQDALDARLQSINSDQYRRNNRYVIEEFLQFLADERNTTSITNVSTLDCRRYAQHLRKRAQDPDDGLGASSCSHQGPYFTIVRAFLDWCVKDERLDTNPAKANRVKDALPENTDTPDQQFWTPEARDQILRYADKRADRVLSTDRKLLSLTSSGKRIVEVLYSADRPLTPSECQERASISSATWVKRKTELIEQSIIQEVNNNEWELCADITLHCTSLPSESWEEALRNRALVYMLAYSGARGAEIFAVSGDSKRKGLRWKEVDFDRGVFQVLGKSRDREWLQLPDDALTRLERYRDVLDPLDDWPVFPSFHAPTLYQRAADVVEDEERLDDEESLDILRECEGRPKAISTDGARNLMKRLCESADIDIDGEYLKPHGGRRGLGDQLYEESAELAQEVLRHKSIETTHKSYRETRTEETRERVEEILD